MQTVLQQFQDQCETIARDSRPFIAKVTGVGNVLEDTLREPELSDATRADLIGHSMRWFSERIEPEDLRKNSTMSLATQLLQNAIWSHAGESEADRGIARGLARIFPCFGEAAFAYYPQFRDGPLGSMSQVLSRIREPETFRAFFEEFVGQDGMYTPEKSPFNPVIRTLKPFFCTALTSQYGADFIERALESVPLERLAYLISRSEGWEDPDSSLVRHLATVSLPSVLDLCRNAKQIFPAARVLKSGCRTFGFEIEPFGADDSRTCRTALQLTHQHTEQKSPPSTDLEGLLESLKRVVDLMARAAPLIDPDYFWTLHLNIGITQRESQWIAAHAAFDLLQTLLSVPANWTQRFHAIAGFGGSLDGFVKQGPGEVEMIDVPSAPGNESKTIDARYELKSLSIGLGPASDVNYVETFVRFGATVIKTSPDLLQLNDMVEEVLEILLRFNMLVNSRNGGDHSSKRGRYQVGFPDPADVSVDTFRASSFACRQELVKFMRPYICWEGYPECAL